MPHSKVLSDLVFVNRTKNKSYGLSFFSKVIREAIKVAGRKNIVYEVGIILVGPARIKQLNETHRNIGHATDVLSFPLGASYGKGYNKIMAGDIFICPSYVAKYAKSENLKLDKRMAWTAVHGFLHLLGYDHEIGEKEFKRMSNLEDKILKNL